MKNYYDIVTYRPAARFYYKGKHSHPVRRTVLIIESNVNFIRGYELREGSIIRELGKAPIKSYSRNKIATLKQLGLNKHRIPGPPVTTLQRMKILDMLKKGI